jgi:hypothetical protein
MQVPAQPFSDCGVLWRNKLQVWGTQQVFCVYHHGCSGTIILREDGLGHDPATAGERACVALGNPKPSESLQAPMQEGAAPHRHELESEPRCSMPGLRGEMYRLNQLARHVPRSMPSYRHQSAAAAVSPVLKPGIMAAVTPEERSNRTIHTGMGDFTLWPFRYER